MKEKMYLPFENGLAVSIVSAGIATEVALLGMDGETIYNTELMPNGFVWVFNGEALTSLLFKIQNLEGL